MHTDNLRKLALETNDGVLRGPALAAADEIDLLRAEINRMTNDRVSLIQAAKDVGVSFRKALARADKAEAERDEARAEQAVLLERAAGRMDAGFSYNAGNCVRGVIPDDAKAALEAYGREKVREGMQRAAGLVSHSAYGTAYWAILADMEKLK